MKIKIETHAKLNSTDQYAQEYLQTNRVFISLFQALCQWGRLKKRAGDEQGMVGKNERSHALSFSLPDPARR